MNSLSPTYGPAYENPITGRGIDVVGTIPGGGIGVVGTIPGGGIAQTCFESENRGPELYFRPWVYVLVFLENCPASLFHCENILCLFSK